MKHKLRHTLMDWVYLNTYVHLHGNEEVRIENCMKILEYNEVLVKLQTRDLTLEFWGNKLRVYDYNDGSVLIRGRISSVIMTEKRG